MSACEESGFRTQDHFTDASKGIPGGKGSVQHVKDYYLSKYACYLIAMNGDPRKSAIALAQTYFAVSTHAYEMHQAKNREIRRHCSDSIAGKFATATGVFPSGAMNYGVSRVRSRGNVVVKRILGTPVSCIRNLSRPIAKPPWGGIP